MSTGLLVILVLLAVGIAYTVYRHRHRHDDTDGRYLIQRPGIAGLHCHPDIPRATAEQMADLVSAIHAETWPVIREAYRAACLERKRPLDSLHGRWNTTRLQPVQLAGGKWTAYGVSSGTWLLVVGCPPVQIAEELQSIARSALGDDVYHDHDLYREAGETVSRWIRERWG